jgi:hypothetical protein
MLEPRGPLPASVYWRRRWITIAVLLAVIALLAWAVVAAAGAATQPGGRSLSTAEVAAAAEPRPLPGDVPTPAESTGATPAAQASAAPSSAPAPDDERARPETPTAVSQPPPGTPTAAGRPAASPPGSLPTPPAAVPAPAAGPAPGSEGPCPDQVIGVAAQVGAPQYKVGERPVFRLVIVNNGPVPCKRDLDAALQELGLFTGDGAKKLWSSNDCFPGKSKDLRTLTPGEPVTFALNWSGRTSAPGCRGSRAPVGAGEYRLLSRLGGIVSPPTQFHLVP